MDKLFKDFVKPGIENYQVPFWSLNDLLNEEEIKRQVSLFADVGYGGFFLHSRIGLKTPYLKEEWLKMLKVAIIEAKKHGLKPWLYDEDKWPSGYAGGIVPMKNEDFRFKFLVCIPQDLDDVELKPTFQGQYYPFSSMEDIRNQFTEKNLITSFVHENKTYNIFKWIAPLGDEALFNTAYVDLMNPETVQEFISSTYQLYYDNYRGEIGTTIPGIFTDEPSIEHPWCNLPFKHLMWTKDFDKIFKKKYGYDFLANVGKLFFDIDDYPKVRYDYCKLVVSLFVESFTKAIYNWCKDHKLKFTGHYLAEDDLWFSYKYNIAVMPHYEFMDYPGIDMLGNRINKIGTFTTIKQASSVAEQLGKKRVLSETYGAGGWESSIRQQKVMAEVQLALGVNFMNPHLCHYSMRGERKRDFPPSIYYQQPYYDYYKDYNEYLASLTKVLTEGRRAVNILLLHPIESVWIESSQFDDSKVKNRTEKFKNLVDLLINNQKDFHFGDESIIEKYGSCHESKFVVGEYKYDYVIVPDILTIRESTLNLLKKFAQAGGKVIILDNMPVYINGMKKDNIVDFPVLKVASEELPLKIDLLLEQDFELDNRNKDIIIHKREIDGREIIFLLNNGLSQSEFHLMLKSRKKIFNVWDCLKRNVSRCETVPDSDITKIKIKLEPFESILLVEDNSLQNSGANEVKAQNNILDNSSNMGKPEELKFSSPWTLPEIPVNALTLDYCEFTVGQVKGSDFTIFLKDKLKNHIGEEITYAFEFRISDSNQLKDEITAVIEELDGMKVFINDNLITSDGKWWTDISFKCFPLGSFIKDGKNIIKISQNVRSETEFESIYLTGKFLVNDLSDNNFEIAPVKKIDLSSDLTRSGFPFYSGNLRLKNNIVIEREPQRVELVFDELNSILVGVSVNGSGIERISWRPFRLDITKFIKRGENNIELLLSSSCRNLLGPHHFTIADPELIGPFSFNDKEHWCDSYNFIKFGLPDNLRIEIF